jgi:hypothetical protein
VLIEVAYAGINRPDCIQRAGHYPPPPDASPIIGLEVAGTVVALGDDVTECRLGDQVCALTPGGGYAEYCATPAAWCLPYPEGLSALEAASLPENYFTVWNNLFDRVHLKSGETVLIQAARVGSGWRRSSSRTRGATSPTSAATTSGVLQDDGRRPRDQLSAAGLCREVAAPPPARVDHPRYRRRRLHRRISNAYAEGRMAIIAFLQGSRVTVDWRTS